MLAYDSCCLQTGMFPKSLRGYVERALSRCKDDTQMAACQAVMKEVSHEDKSFCFGCQTSYSVKFEII